MQSRGYALQVSTEKWPCKHLFPGLPNVISSHTGQSLSRKGGACPVRMYVKWQLKHDSRIVVHVHDVSVTQLFPPFPDTLSLFL